ncbi:putative bifunctional diguanylate cyclase/phosphodiesterase [Glaciecola sp. SC05]|uniref:putative bifunctional diguanylate cyclase/phosphodiesterase n=1 Tax=Glaciecola sp. SC05 TaxID=1987355 RepID=UPI0035270276
MLENTQFVALYFAGTIGINLLCAAFLFVSRIRKYRAQFSMLLLGCFSASLYQFITWQYHSSTDIQGALLLLKVQTSILILCLPAYASLFLRWTKYKIALPYFNAFVALCVLFLVINIASDSSLRFSGALELVQYQVFNNETVARLDGAQSTYMIAFYIFCMLVVCGLAAIVYKAFKDHQFLLFSLLFAALFLQALTGLNGVQIERGTLNSIYFDGLPFTVLNFLACLYIASALNRKTNSLKIQVGIRERLESVLLGLAKGTSNNKDNHFYMNMMHELRRLTNAQLCCICAVEPHSNKHQVHTKAVVYKRKGISNFSFPITKISNELITKIEQGRVIKDLTRFYQDIPIFARVEAKSCFSIPMLNNDGQLEGSIILLFKNTIEENDSLSQTLNIFASRAGAELQRDRADKKLNEMAYFDYQTKLPNMSSLYELIEFCYSRNTVNNTQSGLIMFDLNRFTEVNRNFGFKYSEIAIQTLGERLKAYCSEQIFIARTGGDEFVCLIKDMEHDPKALMRLHWEAICSIVKKPIHAGSFVIRLTCNGGGVVFPEQTKSKVEVIRCAEIALANAKLTHGQALTFFDASSLEAIDRKEILIKMLEPALKSDRELYAVYQPKMDHAGNLLGCEALVRWNNPELGMVSPDEFIQLAEESALVDELGNWMLHQVCQQINKWREIGLVMPARVAINVSPYQLAQEHFLPLLIDTMKHYEVCPSMLEVEITETLLLTNLEDCVDKLKQLQEIGVSIALDDFGTGYSSLQYLNELPLDVIKIDRSFVKNLHKKNTLELAKAIVSISHHMNLKVVAEGVETKEQVQALKEIGCDVFQGYYFSKPIRANELSAWALKKTATSSKPVSHIRG